MCRIFRFAQCLANYKYGSLPGKEWRIAATTTAAAQSNPNYVHDTTNM